MSQSILVKVKREEHFDASFNLPRYETLGAAGADVRASFQDKKSIVIRPYERVLIPTGLSMEIPAGFEIQVRPRSGLSFKTSLMVLNAPGTIDSDYRGEIKIILGNLGQNEEIVNHGDRVAQLVLAPVTRALFEETDTLAETERSLSGFGSTGRQ